MSGPKVSVHSLTATQRKQYNEQMQILNQTEECILKIQKTMGTYKAELSKTMDLVKQAQIRCSDSNKSIDLSAVIDKIQELEKEIEAMNKHYSEIQSSFLKDKEGFIKLSAQMNRERESKLKALLELSKEIGARIKETKQLQMKVLEAVEEYDESMRNELHSKILGGLSISFSSLKREKVQKTSETTTEADEEKQRLEQEKFNLFTRKINDSLQVVAELFGSEEMLSDDLKNRFKQVKQLAAEISSVDFLENFYAISVLPFVNECKVYAEISESYYDLYARYTLLCEEAGIKSEAVTCTAEGIEILRNKIAMLESERLEDMIREYINDSLDEAMRELGYALVGDREKTKKSGKKVRHELYQLEEGTGVDITYGEDGQITMELGGFDIVDRTPNEDEAVRLTEDMHRFCGQYAELEKLLAEKGITRKNVSVLPAAAEFAQIINTEDYNLSKEVSKFEVKKAIKGETQAKHAE